MVLRQSFSPESQPISSVCTKSPFAVASATLWYIQREQTVSMWLEESASVWVCGVFPFLRWNCLEVCTSGTLAWASLTTLDTRFFLSLTNPTFWTAVRCLIPTLTGSVNHLKWKSNPHDWCSRAEPVDRKKPQPHRSLATSQGSCCLSWLMALVNKDPSGSSKTGLF